MTEKRDWEWHNNEVGVGYQAKGVIRQRTAQVEKHTTIIDMSRPIAITAVEPLDREQDRKRKSKDAERKPKKSKKEKRQKHKKNKKEKHKQRDRSDSSDSSDSSSSGQKRRKKDKKSGKEGRRDKAEQVVSGFNPLLQLFATRISNTTREFS